MSQASLFPMPTSGVRVSRARTSRSQIRAVETASQENGLGCSTSSQPTLQLLVPKSFFSKTYRVFSVPTTGEISPESSWRWHNSGILSAGECLTAAISESHSGASASTLLDILEARSVSPKYFLSQNAAMGILKRVQKRGRRLFPPLCEALEKLAKEP